MAYISAYDLDHAVAQIRKDDVALDKITLDVRIIRRSNVEQIELLEKVAQEARVASAENQALRNALNALVDAYPNGDLVRVWQLNPIIDKVVRRG